MPEVEGWLEWIGRTRRQASFGELNPEALRLLLDFEERLNAKLAIGSNNVVGPFAAAVSSLLEAHGIKADARPLRVNLAPDLNKEADLTFSHGGVQWVIEIKTNLEFNSFAAAVLEGMAFKKRVDCRFVILVLYQKNIRGNLADVLGLLELKSVVDDLVILSRNGLKGEAAWCQDFVERLNDFTNWLPRA